MHLVFLSFNWLYEFQISCSSLSFLGGWFFLFFALEDYCKLQTDNYNVQRTRELLMDRPTDGLSAQARAWYSSPLIGSRACGLGGWERGGVGVVCRAPLYQRKVSIDHR